MILLLDDRFADRRYRETFPREWASYSFCNGENASEKIRKFWESEKED